MPVETREARGVDMIHVVPRAALVDRVDCLLDLTRGRRVAHLGFVDAGRMHAKNARGTWLHARLAEATRELVGIDLGGAGIAAARALGYEAYEADCQDTETLAALGLERFDIVLAGELIEHLDRPGAMLEAVKELLSADGRLVLTTPNAHALVNFAAALLGRELVNDDHVSWYSWRTLMTMLRRHGWEPDHVSFYVLPRIRGGADLSARQRMYVRAFTTVRSLTRPLLRLRPALADGLVVTARRR